MKISILTSIARQVEGEFIFINVVKAHKDSTVLWKHLAQTDLPKVAKIQNTDCVIEYGILEDVEVEGFETKESE